MEEEYRRIDRRGYPSVTQETGEELKQPGLEGLLPLLPLTKNGDRREVVEEMIVALQTANKEDLLPIAYAVAAIGLESFSVLGK